MSEPSCWSGQASPHRLAEALSVLLPLLPLEARARAACVCRAWRAATSHPALWEELSFERFALRVNDATLSQLCARAGAALRTLTLDSDACKRTAFRDGFFTPNGLLAALRDGGCTGLRRLNLPVSKVWFEREQELTAEVAQELAAACPALQHAACEVHCSLSEAVAVSTELPGPLTLHCQGDNCLDDSHGDFMQLAECMRDKANVVSLKLLSSHVGNAGAAQLAECLRVNAVLTSLDLEDSGIEPAGAMQLAECLRVNATLKSLGLKDNFLGEAAATQLAESLRVNATLTSLNLACTAIGAAGAMRLIECLRVNATLTSLNLRRAGIAAEGTARLAACLRINTTLRSLDLTENNIGAAGATQLADSLRVNASLTRLNLRETEMGIEGTTQLALCLRVNTTLTYLDLSGNYVDQETLVESMRSNTTLRGLELKDCGLGDYNDYAVELLREACPRCTFYM